MDKVVVLDVYCIVVVGNIYGVEVMFVVYWYIFLKYMDKMFYVFFFFLEQIGQFVVYLVFCVSFVVFNYKVYCIFVYGFFFILK